MHTHAARVAAPSNAHSTTPACAVAPCGKVPRERTMRLTVETEICPQVILRVLGLLAQRWIVPFTIDAVRSDDAIRLTVEIQAPSPGECEALVAKTEAIVMVRSARLD